MHLFDTPFRRPASLNLFDIVGDSVIAVLVEGGRTGMGGVSISAVAKAGGTTPQALHQRLDRLRTDKGESPTETLFRMASHVLADRWIEWVRGSLTAAYFGTKPEVRLPETDDERQGVAAWLAWRELARGRQITGDPVPAEIVGDARAQEVALVKDALEVVAARPVGELESQAVVALADGLRAQLAWPQATMDLARAREVMARQVAAVIADATRPAA